MFGALKLYLQMANGKLEALSSREQWLIAIAVPVVIALVAQTFVIDPEVKMLAGLSAKNKAEGYTRVALVAQLENSPAKRQAVKEQNLQEQVERLQADIDSVQVELSGLMATMLEAKKIPMLLQVLLEEHDLELVSLRNLAPESVLSEQLRTEMNTQVNGNSGLYRHGIDLTLRGKYLDVLTYLQRLENQPWKLIWRSLKYEVTEHPTGELHLQLQTLSHDKQWLGV